MMLTRKRARPGATGLRAFFCERGSKWLTARWRVTPMYRYRHNKRLRAAFLCDFRLGRWRG